MVHASKCTWYTKILQRSAKKLDMQNDVYFSTDYVFDGQGTDAMEAGLQGLRSL